MTADQLAGLAQVLAGAGLLGTVMPVVVSIIIRSAWPSWAKAAVALGSSVAAGTASAWAAGDLAGLTWPAAVVVALTASQLAYRVWWKPTGIGRWIESHVNAGKTFDGEVLSSTTTSIEEKP